METKEKSSSTFVDEIYSIPRGMTKPITEEQRKDFEAKDKSCVEFSKLSLKLFNDVVLANKDYLNIITGNIYTMKSYYMGLVDSKEQGKRKTEPEPRIGLFGR
jgi:F420-non-reducing hydrogenase large subunit